MTRAASAPPSSSKREEEVRDVDEQVAVDAVVEPFDGIADGRAGDGLSRRLLLVDRHVDLGT
jgi:hypothetical protein